MKYDPQKLVLLVNEALDLIRHRTIEIGQEINTHPCRLATDVVDNLLCHVYINSLASDYTKDELDEALSAGLNGIKDHIIKQYFARSEVH